MSKVNRKKAQPAYAFERVNTPEKAKKVGDKVKSNNALKTIKAPVLGWERK